MGGNVTPNKVARSGIKADPLQTSCLFCMPQFTGPFGVGNVRFDGPVQENWFCWYMQVRGPPGVGNVRFDGPVIAQFIRGPGFVQVTLIVWLGLELGVELGVGLGVGLGVVGVELGVGLGVESGVGLGVGVGVVPGLHVEPDASMHGVGLGAVLGLHVEPDASMQGVGLLTGGFLHCRLNFTEPLFSVSKSFNALGIC